MNTGIKKNEKMVSMQIEFFGEELTSRIYFYREYAPGKFSVAGYFKAKEVKNEILYFLVTEETGMEVREFAYAHPSTWLEIVDAEFLTEKTNKYRMPGTPLVWGKVNELTDDYKRLQARIRGEVDYYSRMNQSRVKSDSAWD